MRQEVIIWLVWYQRCFTRKREPFTLSVSVRYTYKKSQVKVSIILDCLGEQLGGFSVLLKDTQGCRGSWTRDQRGHFCWPYRPWWQHTWSCFCYIICSRMLYTSLMLWCFNCFLPKRMWKCSRGKSECPSYSESNQWMNTIRQPVCRTTGPGLSLSLCSAHK